jgi:LuxR family maltose regulon positive regulatory protein
MFKPVALLNPRSTPSRGEFAVPDWILSSKLDPPQLRANAVPRIGLLQRLQQAQLFAPLTLLLAPPGFGKTTLLAQWHHYLQTNGNDAAAWLSLDEEDADVGRFLGHLALALQNAGAESGICTALLQQRHDSDPYGAVNALIRAIRSGNRIFYVLLDDYDRASSSAVDEVILRLIEHAGPRLRLVLSTRRAPALPLARLELLEQLARIGTDELAMDEQETLAVLGESTTTEVASELHHYTEGWPVALHLARLWLTGNNQRHSEMSRFSGRSAQIAAYLAEQVINELSPATRDFLLRTAPLQRFNAALADHVRGSCDSGMILAQLDHFHGLLVPLDGEHEWYRYHPLFADYLQQQFEREQPGQLPLIHRAAAHWFARYQLLSESVRHAVYAGDVSLAASYIAEAGTWQLLFRLGTARVRALLCHFDHKTIRDTPALNLTQAYLHMKLGELTHAQLLLERYRALPSAEREIFQRDYTVVIALLRCLLDEICSNPAGLSQLTAQTDALDEDDHISRGIMLRTCAISALGLGEFSVVQMHATAACEAMAACDCPVGMSYALLQLGQTLYYRGQLDEAKTVYQQIITLGEQYEEIDAIPHAAASCLLAQLQYERGHYQQAAALLEHSLPFVEQHDGWLDIYASAYETALGLARQRDRSGRSALSLLDHIDQFAHTRKLARLTELAVAWRLSVLLEQPTTPAIDALVARTGGESSLAHTMSHANRWRERTAMGFALARWHRLAGRSGAALAVLTQIKDCCIACDNQSHLARARARIALVLQQRGETLASLPLLHAALDHIALTQSWQVIVELGVPAKAMLRSIRQHDPQTIAGTTRAHTIKTLLEKLSGEEEALSEDFSEREIEVLTQLAHGYSNKQIARRLHLSENTVKFHLKNLYRKLEARTRKSALTNALQRGLLRTPTQPQNEQNPH